MGTRQRSGQVQAEEREQGEAAELKKGEALELKSAYAFRRLGPEIRNVTFEDTFYVRRRNRDGTPGPLVGEGAKIGRNVYGHYTALIGPGVFVRGNVTIKRGVLLMGEVHLGFGCTIGPQSDIFDAKLGNGVVTGRNVYIEGTYDGGPGVQIGDKVVVRDLAEIRNSMVSDDAVVGEEAIINGLVNGVTIGKGARIGARAILEDAVVVYEGSKVQAGKKVPFGVVVSNAKSQTPSLKEAMGTLPQRRDV